MKLNRAKMSDLDQIIEILADGRDQLAEKGVDQWQGDYPSREHVKYDIEHGFAFLAESTDHETIGALSLVTAPDHSYDQLHGKWLVDTTAYIVIHRVAIHSNHGGHGYATQLFEKVIEEVEQNHPEIDSIRIDTHKNNGAMQHVIAKTGFEKVGELVGVYGPTDECFVYEKVIRRADLSQQKIAG
ncbi:MAG TPA: GNAT family N-acetyltransferase [Candidatus Ligilactobacillus excrementipullorum]|nr:GNAT family N-acetyltransferase [Candidatus Ligilactobacillus excrementipullorum]